MLTASIYRYRFLKKKPPGAINAWRLECSNYVSTVYGQGVVAVRPSVPHSGCMTGKPNT